MLFTHVHGITHPSWVILFAHTASYRGPNRMHDDLLGCIYISRAISSYLTILSSFWSTVTDGNVNIRSSAYIHILAHVKRKLQQYYLLFDMTGWRHLYIYIYIEKTPLWALFTHIRVLNKSHGLPIVVYYESYTWCKFNASVN